MAVAFGNFHEDIKIIPIASYASANSDRNSEVIDCADFDQVMIVVHHAAVGNSGAYDIYLTSSDAVTDENTLSNGANVSGSSQTVADADDNTAKYFVFKPEKRYYQMVFNKDAATTYAESAIAYGHAKTRPVTQSTGNTTVGEGTGAVTGEFLGLAIQGTK